MSKKTFRIVLTISLLGCLLYYTMNTTQRFQTKIENLHLELQYSENNFYCTIDSINKFYQESLDSLPLGSPLVDVSVSSTYGLRKKPLGGGWRMHSGIDLNGTRWDTVFSTGHGIVKMARWNSGYGKCIVVDHTSGYSSKYAHLSKIFVRPGQLVSVGEPIGKCGSTGFSTGQHLHYEINIKGKTVDPYLFLFFDTFLQD